MAARRCHVCPDEITAAVALVVDGNVYCRSCGHATLVLKVARLRNDVARAHQVAAAEHARLQRAQGQLAEAITAHQETSQQP